MLFDSHAHLDGERFDNDRDLVINRAKANGIEFARAAVRPGYEKYLKAAGWKSKMVLMDFDLKGN